MTGIGLPNTPPAIQGPNGDFNRYMQGLNRPIPGYVYLAAPYYSENKELMALRREAIARMAKAIIEQGYAVFSPIAYTVKLEEDGIHYPDGWYTLDMSFLAAATGVVLLCLPGWEDSKGVLTELGFARGKATPIAVVEHREMEEAIGADQLKKMQTIWDQTKGCS